MLTGKVRHKMQTLLLEAQAPHQLIDYSGERLRLPAQGGDGTAFCWEIQARNQGTDNLARVHRETTSEPPPRFTSFRQRSQMGR